MNPCISLGINTLIYRGNLPLVSGGLESLSVLLAVVAACRPAWLTQHFEIHKRKYNMFVQNGKILNQLVCDNLQGVH